MDSTTPNIFPGGYYTGANPDDPRIRLQVDRSLKSGLVFLGYPNDEGVARNGGRVGAKGGPDVVRGCVWHNSCLTQKIPQPKNGHCLQL